MTAESQYPAVIDRRYRNRPKIGTA